MKITTWEVREDGQIVPTKMEDLMTCYAKSAEECRRLGGVCSTHRSTRASRARRRKKHIKAFDHWELWSPKEQQDFALILDTYAARKVAEAVAAEREQVVQWCRGVANDKGATYAARRVLSIAADQIAAQSHVKVR